MIWDVSSFVVCLSVFISLYLWDSYLKKGEHWLKFMMGTFTDRPKDILPRGSWDPLGNDALIILQKSFQNFT